MKLNKKKTNKNKKKFFSNRKSRNRRSKKRSIWNMFGCANNMKGGEGCGCTAGAPALMNGGGDCIRSNWSYPSDYIKCANNLAFTGTGGKKRGRGRGRGGGIDSGSGSGSGISTQTALMHAGVLAMTGGTSGDNMPMGAKYPSGTVGSPWGSYYSNWPGVNGIQGDKNFYMLNSYNNQPDYSPSIQERTTPAMSTGGSRKYRKVKKSNKNRKTNTFRKHSYSRKYVGLNKRNKVGGLFELGILSDIKNSINAINGSPQAVSPLPFNDQLNSSNNCNITNTGTGIVM